MKAEVTDQLVIRLKRIEGQVRAVQRMLEEGTQEPKQIMMQLSALISSLENTKIAIVEEFTKERLMASIESLSELLK